VADHVFAFARETDHELGICSCPAQIAEQEETALQTRSFRPAVESMSKAEGSKLGVHVRRRVGVRRRLNKGDQPHAPAQHRQRHPPAKHPDDEQPAQGAGAHE